MSTYGAIGPVGLLSHQLRLKQRHLALFHNKQPIPAYLLQNAVHVHDAQPQCPNASASMS
jgi:hypothetical protein